MQTSYYKKNSTGYNTVVQWPSFGLGAKGNAGVAAQVKNLNNTIGYVEYAFAHGSHLSIAKIITNPANITSLDFFILVEVLCLRKRIFIFKRESI